MLFILVLAVIGGFGIYVMTPAERMRLLQAALTAIRRANDEFVRRRSEPDGFRDALHARTRWAPFTPAIVALNVAVFTCMLFGRGAFSDPATLVGWGGNFAPRTTNGEWSRLLTSMFVHTGLLHLLVNIAGLVQVGLLVERLVGPLAVAGVFAAAGALASAVSLEAHPMAVTAGADGGIFGLYGLLLSTAACAVWSEWRRQRSAAEPVEDAPDAPQPPRLMIPLRVVRDMGPAAAVFTLYHLAGGFAQGELAGAAVGVVCGIVLSMNIAERKPVLKHVAIPFAATAVIVAAAAYLQPRVADVRPEIARVLALEDRTAVGYDKAVAQFRKGSLSAEALALHIDKTITPELREARARLKALTGVPPEHQAMIASADEYLRLRDESWRLRAEGLHKSSMVALKKAETPERAALAALGRIAPPRTTQ
jgi:membrane associated rhomboid family serine protease